MKGVARIAELVLSSAMLECTGTQKWGSREKANVVDVRISWSGITDYTEISLAIDSE